MDSASPYRDKKVVSDICIPLVRRFNGMGKTCPLVLFIGHGSHSANNPFGSSLDVEPVLQVLVGIMQMLAKIANIPSATSLEENHNIGIQPVPFWGEHNTTTDEILLFDSVVQTLHINQLQKLKLNLLKTQQTATQERLAVANNSVALQVKKQMVERNPT
jgi:uncharacterized protein YbcC (UPF0753/DUF2309 family)